MREVDEQLLKAIRLGDKVMVQKAIDAGAHTNAPTEEGNTSMHYACHYKSKDQAEIMRILFKNGADIYRENVDGECPLSIAMNSNNKIIKKEMIQFRKNLKKLDNYFSKKRERDPVSM